MDSAVVSDHLKGLLDDREVKAAVFTTYNFDPEFFELEVIPLLLSGNIPFSSDSRVKQLQVREALRESAINIDVFYDLPLFRQEGSISPSMEYQFHGIQRGNSVFHAKLVLVLAHDEKYDADCLLVGAGSNNLTQSGWWDNIECVHWETVWLDETDRAFLNRLKDDVEWLVGERYLDIHDNKSALNMISEYLSRCKSWGKADPVAYYGLNDIDRGSNFTRFIRQQAKRNWSYSNWTLEIISPFFSEDPKNKNHEIFFDLGVQEIHMLMPTDQEGNVLCQEEYFNFINEQDGIQWAEWDEGSAKLLGLKGQHFRRLHAKVYHFYNRKQSWTFIGSVNFSHKAMRENIEAGFFVKIDKPAPLLKPIKRPDLVENFESPTELPPGIMEDDEISQLPRIYLSYDWVYKRLTGITERGKNYTISILTPEGEAAIADWSITGAIKDYEGATDRLEQLLRNGSLVNVAGFNTRSDESFPSHNVMLMQAGWTHKPIDMPDLTPEQILAIYADMAPDQRQLLLMNAKIRELIIEGVAGDMTLPDDDCVVEQFFSEYSEIFHAFRRLKKRLSQALQDNNHAVIDYYLTGTGMDSLPILIDRAVDPDSHVNHVTTYLILLCAREIYDDSDFKRVHQINQKLRDVKRKIKQIKLSDAIKLENNENDTRKRFFSWFEHQFLKKYKVREGLE